jgi:osmotically-inducible protein OsmY
VAFQQGSAGGQIPAEYRQWSPETPRRRHRPGSDERIREELCDRLMADPHVDASEIEVEVQQGRILLRGTVPDRRAKHRAEDLADAILGSTEIDNQLRVRH